MEEKYFAGSVGFISFVGLAGVSPGETHVDTHVFLCEPHDRGMSGFTAFIWITVAVDVVVMHSLLFSS